MSEPKENLLRTLYGGKIESTKAVAYCWHHHAYLTAKQLKKKRCLAKNCGAFRRVENQFWEQRDRKDRIKQMKKEAGIPVWQKVTVRTNCKGEVIGIK